MIGIENSRVIEEIKARVALSDIVSRHVKLKRAGRSRMVGLCPFHHEKTPSFYVDDEKGLYHCFGCGKGGDVINFVMETENLSFREAVEELAHISGVELPEGWFGVSKSEASLSERIIEANREAGIFYLNILLNDPGSAKAREYLTKRNVPETFIKKFGLGFAPDSWDGLSKHLRNKGFTEYELERAGLVINGQRGIYDRFRNRIMFPILMRERQVLGFSGRTIDEDEQAKYINTPETPVYSKSKVLFGFNLARDSISKQSEAIIVEGNFDVLRMHQFGFTNTVAPCGTALTADQVRMTKRLGASLLLIFDGDEAGRKAAFRMLPIVMPMMVETKVVFLPSGDDPDSLLLRDGAGRMNELIASAQDLFSAYIEYKRNQNSNSPEALASLMHEIASLLASISDAAVREAFINHASYLLGTSERALRTTVYQESRRRRISPDETSNPNTSLSTEIRETLDADELGLLLSVLQNKSLLYDEWFWNRIDGIGFSARMSRILDKLRTDPRSIDELVNSDTDIGKLLRRKSMELDTTEEDTGIELYLLKIEEKSLMKEIDRLGVEISRAEHERETDKLRSLLVQRRELYRRREEISESVRSIKNSLTRSSADGG